MSDHSHAIICQKFLHCPSRVGGTIAMVEKPVPRAPLLRVLCLHIFL